MLGSTAKLTRCGEFVVKKVVKAQYNHTREDLFDNEVWALRRLCGHAHFPQLVQWDRRRFTIVMSYCGTKIRSAIRPPDWVAQATQMMISLDECRVDHNDIQPQNLLVLGNTIYLVDFGRSREGHSDAGLLFKTIQRYMRARPQ